MNKYKTFEELKEELGDKFEEYMYKANIELLTKIDKAIKYNQEIVDNYLKEYDCEYCDGRYATAKYNLEILKGDNNE